MFMKGLAVQYDVWAETHYQRMLSVSGPVIDLHVYSVRQAAVCVLSNLPMNRLGTVNIPGELDAQCPGWGVQVWPALSFYAQACWCELISVTVL